MKTFQDELREYFKYDAQTGMLLHPKCWVCGKPDAKATSLHCEGYQTTTFKSKRYLMHRLVWIYFNGDIPKGYIIDHINHDRADSRIENLRLVSRSENNKNLPLRKTNKSGYHNILVTRTKRGDRYTARMHIDGKVKSLGTYDTFEEALRAKKSKEQELGYHTNHGGILVAD